MTLPPSGNRRSRRFIRAALVAAVLAFGEAALSPLHADTYQFIVSGYPAANESYAAASVGIAFATATRSGGSAAGGSVSKPVRQAFSHVCGALRA